MDVRASQRAAGGGDLPTSSGNHASGYQAFAVGVLRIDRGRIAEMVAFHDATLFPTFGLPGTLPADEG